MVVNLIKHYVAGTKKIHVAVVSLFVLWGIFTWSQPQNGMYVLAGVVGVWSIGIVLNYLIEGANL